MSSRVKEGKEGGGTGGGGEKEEEEEGREMQPTAGLDTYKEAVRTIILILKRAGYTEVQKYKLADGIHYAVTAYGGGKESQVYYVKWERQLFHAAGIVVPGLRGTGTRGASSLNEELAEKAREYPYADILFANREEGLIFHINGPDFWDKSVPHTQATTSELTRCIPVERLKKWSLATQFYPPLKMLEALKYDEEVLFPTAYEILMEDKKKKKREGDKKGKKEEEERKGKKKEYQRRYRQEQEQEQQQQQQQGQQQQQQQGESLFEAVSNAIEHTKLEPSLYGVMDDAMNLIREKHKITEKERRRGGGREGEEEEEEEQLSSFKKLMEEMSRFRMSDSKYANIMIARLAYELGKKEASTREREDVDDSPIGKLRK